MNRWIVNCGVFCLLPLLSASAQVVQLPTFRQFSIGTTVSVPDRGGAALGGVNSARAGSTSRSLPGAGRLPFIGPLFNQRAMSNQLGSSQSFVRVTIIDHQAWEEASSRAWVNRPGRPAGNAAVDAELERRAAFLSQHVGRSKPSLSTTVSNTSSATANLPPRVANSALRRPDDRSSIKKSARRAEPPLILKRQ